jgi:N,N'-diacetyllegionaminate synthase
MKNNYFAERAQAYLIAEIGVNHNGDVNLAREMIMAAKLAGADAVKFQTFTAETLASIDTPKVKYQEDTTSSDETHYEMLRKLELSKSTHRKLFDFCAKANIDFLSTPYDIESAKFLVGLGVKMFKTASADLVDLPLQRYIASTGKPTIVATGMASLGDVEHVVDIFTDTGNPHLILLHCVSNYPCSDSSLNLRAMTTLGQAFSLPVGYSDHSEGFLAAVISLAMGAKVIEKHFTLDKKLPGPDHKASSSPDEFAELVRNVRRAELMLGTRRKTCQPEERQMADVSRKSIVLAKAMRAGEIIKLSDLILRRPGNGLSANYLPKIVGMSVRNDLNAQHMLSWNDVKGLG